MKIVKGAYPPIPPHYSRELKTFVSQLLSTDPMKRPRINSILRTLHPPTLGLPLIKSRINEFLSQTQMSVEFAHTILHKQNIFNQPAPAINPNDNKGYYKNLHEEMKNMVIPKREAKEVQKMPEPACKAPQKKLEVPAKKPANPKPKNQVFLNPPKVNQENNKKVSANPSPEQVKRPASNQVPARIDNAPKMQPVKAKPTPNFYVHDYKPYKYEEPACAMVIPLDTKSERKPQSQADQRKRLEELKERARKEEKKKEELLKEHKKREEERSERMKKRNQERTNMRKDIEKKRRGGNKFNNKGFGLIQLPEIKELDNLSAPLKESEPVPVPTKEKTPSPKKDVEEAARETAKFAEEVPKAPQVDSLMRSRSILIRADLLAKSIIERQKAKLKEEERLEQDVAKLSEVYKNVRHVHIVGAGQPKCGGQKCGRGSSRSPHRSVRRRRRPRRYARVN
eukprot:TRINITY_DN3779_c0_g1_i1.p1 TRINITY_DN3779_c0_g1~~TRINITY_DN3779_c0_g1_i1.p1  ORF type:complete len:453 (-),score=69.62 TRINITY_DN3779_c0_g1_i1:108-1466(-)